MTRRINVSRSGTQVKASNECSLDRKRTGILEMGERRVPSMREDLS
jgi:hypothetical protein